MPILGPKYGEYPYRVAYTEGMCFMGLYGTYNACQVCNRQVYLNKYKDARHGDIQNGFFDHVV